MGVPNQEDMEWAKAILRIDVVDIYYEGQFLRIAGQLSDYRRAIQAEMRELGPCGKHSKIFLRIEEGVELEGNKQVYFRDKVCTLCEEIRLAVEKAREPILAIVDSWHHSTPGTPMLDSLTALNKIEVELMGN